VQLIILLLAAGCGGEAPPVAVATAQEEAAAAPALPPLPPPLLEVLRLEGMGRAADARDLARRYVAANPGDGRGYLMVGITHLRAGNYEPAVEQFHRALELAPEYHLTQRYLGEGLFLLGDLSGARVAYAALVAADPHEPEGEYGLGVVEFEQGRLAEAEAHLGRAVALFDAMRRSAPRRFAARGPDLARCHARLADVAMARQDYAAARQALLRATAIEPRNISAFYTLSVVHRRLGEEELAEQALQRYLAGRAAVTQGATGGAR
jgi:tetratricopeptide (TPR) repeat protein